MSFFQFRPAFSILAAQLMLLGIGVIMIYSSSAIYAEQNFGSPYYFLWRHLFHLLLGFLLLALCAKLDYKLYERLMPFLMSLSVILLLLVLIPGIGKQVGNARRWIRIMGFGFQPSELLKLTLIIWAAGFSSRRKSVLSHFSRGILPTLMVIGIFFFLLLLQPDFGTAILISFTLLLMIFVAGVKPSHMLISLSGFSVVALVLVLSKTYRLKRLIGFFHPWQEQHDSGYQLVQSLIAFGTGGIFGRDLGNSRQKLFFLPESHTDFIFSILAEEAGFIGVFIVLALFVIFLNKGIQIALSCRDDFGKSLAFGITMIIILQCMVNIGVVIGLLPTKGIPLPFISYGGSSLVISMAMTGILINIAGQNRLQKRS